MRDPENIAEVSKLDINLMGFIFWPRSKRYVENPEMSCCRSPLLKTGVFVNATVEEIMEKVRRFSLDFVQLHGDETPEECQGLKEMGVQVIKAFPISSEEDLCRTKPYEGCVSYFLFDTKTEGRGGSGRLFDWNVLSSYAGTTPFFLSGGLKTEYVEEIGKFHHKQLAGIDLNSGFEKEPGLKDVDLLKDFINKIRQLETDKSN